MAEEWQTQEFRQNVIVRITEMLQSSGQDARSASAMENQFFRKSRSKQEYLGSVAKLFMHFKDMQRRPQQAPQANPEMQQQNMPQDPLNALQNLASQGNRPQMMSMQNAPVGPVPASNLLQTLNQQRPGQQQMPVHGIRVQMPMGGTVGPGAGVGPNSNEVSGPGNQQMPQQMSGNINNTAGNMQINSINNVQQGQMVGNPQQMGGMSGQMGQLNSSGQAGANGPPGLATNAGAGAVGAGAMQQNAGGPMNVNAINVQQMQQMNQNQMGMNMNHPQVNQMMNARLNPAAANASAQLMQGMQQNASGPVPANNVSSSGGATGAAGSGPQAQLVGMPPNNTQTGPPNQMLNMPGNIQQRPNTPLQQGGQMFAVNRGIVGQQQFLRQSPSPSSGAGAAQQQLQQQQQQQAQQQQQQQQQQIGQTNQPQTQGPQLPTPQMIPSPALVPTSSPQMSSLMQNQQRNIRQQSPSANLNTPGQVSQNSPFNPHEDQLYREKYKQLTKYIEPLKRMVAKIGNDGKNAEKITKMSKLLQILCNPSERVPLETLLKCEKALEKMEPCLFSGQQFVKSSNPLMEVINATLQSPIANHTLHRTFRPSLEMLFGSNISAPALPKRPRMEKKTTFDLEIPHVLQGEIARLDSYFKITLDSSTQNNTLSIRLICCLDDKRLPSVPSISVDIPEEYPFTSPSCVVAEQDYMKTAFLKMVYNTFMARIAKLPKMHSLTHILNTWEMSVRHSCSPTARTVCDFNTAFATALFK